MNRTFKACVKRITQTQTRFMLKHARLLLLFVFCSTVYATDVHFDLNKFNASPSGGRTVTLQPLQPFPGNLITNISADDGTFTQPNLGYGTNPVDYAVSIRALGAAQKIDFQITVLATNLGTLEADLITSQLGIQTYPTAGKSSWTILTMENRYQLSGTVLSNTFYPLFSNPSNYLSSAVVALSNYVTVGSLSSSNYATISLLNTASNFLQSQIVDGAVTLPQITNVAVYISNLSSNLVYGNSSTFALTIGNASTNFTMSASNNLYSQITQGGISALNATNLANSFNGVIGTNGSPLAYKFTTTGTNNILSIAETLTNGFVDKSITNNAATIALLNATSNTLATAASSGINALTATNINNSGGGVIGTNGSNLTYKFSTTGTNAILGIAETLTNGFVDKAITNNAATVAQLNLKMASTNGFSTNQLMSGATVVGPSVWLSTNSSPPTPIFQDYDPLNEDVVRLTHGGAEFFWGITNGLNQSFIDFNLDGESEYTIQASDWQSVAHRFYIFYPGTVATNYFEITWAGVRAPIATAPFIGNGSGLTNASSSNLQAQALGQVTNVVNALSSGATVALTNAYGTNLPTLLNTGQRIYVPTNFDIKGGSNFLFGINATSSNFNATANATASNFLAGANATASNALASANSTASNFLATINATGSNFLQLEKVDATNGFAKNLTVTNNTALEGSVSFGAAGGSTNIVASTNYIRFIGAGTSLATNGAFIWSGALNLYTNWLNGAVITNNGSAWLLQTNGNTLYSLSTTSPLGSYSAVSGALPAPTAYMTAAINDGMIQLGYFSVSNLQGMSNSIITNIVTLATNNYIANNSGYGTNTYLTNATMSWWSSAANLMFQAFKGGQNNSISGSGYGAAVLSGATNSLSIDGAGIVVGGMFNALGGGSGNADVIVGGARNTLVGIGGTGNIGGNFIGAGLSNRLGSSFFSFLGAGSVNDLEGSHAVILGGQANTNLTDGGVILGGQSNRVNGLWSVAAGRNVNVTNDNVFSWSDGTVDNSKTNAQHRVTATNGFYLNGPLWLSDANTNHGVYIISNQFSLFAVTNAMPNFATWVGPSNGVLVMIYNSNGVPIMEKLWQ